jgi:hypothetical protein
VCEVKATNAITDEELQEAFLKDPVFGIRLLLTDFRDPICRYTSPQLFGLAPSLRAEATKELYQDTMVAVVE